MTNGCGILDTTCTHSCAYNKVRPSPTDCRQEGNKTCTGNTGDQGNCCANLICNAPGADKTALGNGTCVKAPASLGETCNTCLPGNKWDSAKNSCTDSSGNNTNPVSAVYCSTINQTCTQGEGCVETESPDVGSPMPPPCSVKDANGTCLFMNTDFGPIAIDPTLFIKSIFGIILSLSGGIALLLIIVSGYRMLISQGNPEALKGAREQLIAAIVGLLFIVFALVILQIIGYDILRIPSFK
jgi:hypothetical protein